MEVAAAYAVRLLLPVRDLAATAEWTATVEGMLLK